LQSCAVGDLIDPNGFSAVRPVVDLDIKTHVEHGGPAAITDPRFRRRTSCRANAKPLVDKRSCSCPGVVSMVMSYTAAWKPACLRSKSRGTTPYPLADNQVLPKRDALLSKQAPNGVVRVLL
jgi:hypothetical protein